MVIVALKNQKQLEARLVRILNLAQAEDQVGIVIMTNIEWHMEVFDWFLKRKGVKRVIVAGSTYFMIKQMRIEIKPIHHYV